MEAEDLLPCSQEPNSSPYPAPDEASPYPEMLFLSDPFQYYLAI
jgi:hypothetical protein